MIVSINSKPYTLEISPLEKPEPCPFTIKGLSMQSYREGNKSEVRIHFPPIKLNEITLKDLTFNLDRKAALEFIKLLSTCLMELED